MRQRGMRGRWKRVVVGLATAATIVGGIAAAIQIYQYYVGRTGPSEMLEPGWRRIRLAGGLSVALPEQWDMAHPDAVRAIMRAFGPLGLVNPKDLDAMSVVVQRAAGSDGPSAVLFFGVLPTRVGDLDAMVRACDASLQFQSCTKVPLARGPALHGITHRRGTMPDGDELALVLDSYFIPRGSRTLFAMLATEASAHLAFSGMFTRAVDTLEFTEPVEPKRASSQ